MVNVTIATEPGSEGVDILTTEMPPVSTPSASELGNETLVNGNDTITDFPVPDPSSDLDLGTGVIVAIAVGSALVLIVVMVMSVYYIRKHYHKKKSKAWVDNLTLSYIADSNIDLTKDSNDEMVSLDNDNFLNSLESNMMSVWTPDANAKQYTYSYF